MTPERGNTKMVQGKLETPGPVADEVLRETGGGYCQDPRQLRAVMRPFGPDVLIDEWGDAQRFAPCGRAADPG